MSGGPQGLQQRQLSTTEAFGCALDLDDDVLSEEVAMAKDPICGMDVDPANPPGGKTVYRGTTYYFCGPGCKETFDKDPERHAAAA
jgi:YHS domain-containing protein